MISLKKRNQGFTIVELLIVIVVIGILALLVVTTYSGIQQKARNSKRSTDIQTIQTQLEAFYNENGYYPLRANLNSSSWRTTNMKSLDSGALKDPSNKTACETDNNCLIAASDDDNYGYAPTAAAGASCAADETTCVEYDLTAEYEGTVNGEDDINKTELN